MNIVSPDPVDGEVPLTNSRHVLVLQVDDPVGVLHDGAGVASKEILGGVILTERSELCPGAVSPQERQIGVPASLVRRSTVLTAEKSPASKM